MDEYEYEHERRDPEVLKWCAKLGDCIPTCLLAPGPDGVRYFEPDDVIRLGIVAMLDLLPKWQRAAVVHQVVNDVEEMLYYEELGAPIPDSAALLGRQEGWPEAMGIEDVPF